MMVPVEGYAERSRTASDGSEMADNPTISPHPRAATDQQKRSGQAAAENVLKRPPAAAAVTDALSTLGLSFQHQPLVEELPGRNQGVGQRPWVLPDIMARKEVRRQGCIKAVPRSVHSSGPNCASGHSVPPGSNRQHRRLGLGYRFRAERRAGRGCHNRGNTRWPRRKQGSLGRFR